MCLSILFCFFFQFMFFFYNSCLWNTFKMLANSCQCLVMLASACQSLPMLSTCLLLLGNSSMLTIKIKDHYHQIRSCATYFCQFQSVFSCNLCLFLEFMLMNQFWNACIACQCLVMLTISLSIYWFDVMLSLTLVYM